uniref:hypothetical protein n=1 Tax=Lachnoclostridium phocaeense TaxID=1871021 RepID=UPI0026DB9E1B|nr:hypothetical protein [Lachnoclostridium phocaeense]
MLFELINPSDPYVFEAKDLEVATLTVMALSPVYGAATEDEQSHVPVLFLLDPDEWFEETFGRSVSEAMSKRAKELADALLSMTYGTFSDYKLYQDTMKLLDSPEKKEAYAKRWNSQRSSLNAIADVSHRMAERFYKLVKEKGEESLC